MTCQGVCSRYEFAQEIFKAGRGWRPRLRAVPTAESQLSSARPAYAVLDNFILRIDDPYQMPQWKDSLKEYMEERKEELGWEQRQSRRKK